MDWNQIRKIDGTQQDGFEELCCQLARSEAPSCPAEFIRKGKPDSGLECFWKLASGKEWGWQAKFFRYSLENTQWAQLDDSVKSALDGHPQLERYHVCIPRNLPDARRGGQKSARDRWNDRVAKWQDWAREREIGIEFLLWDASKLEFLLSKEEHRGRYWYWFNETALTKDWFRKRLDEAISGAGARYSRELHTDLDISVVFDALTRNRNFWDRLNSAARQLRGEYDRLDSDLIRQHCADAIQALDEAFEVLLRRCSATFKPSDVCARAVKTIDWSELSNRVGDVREGLEHIQGRIAALPETQQSDVDRRAFHSKREMSVGKVLKFRLELDDFEYLFRDQHSKLANAPFLLVRGRAGTGKTHLLCDAALRDFSQGAPRILFHGGNLVGGNPFVQMLQDLDLNCTFDEFLGGLEAAAQCSGNRILIFVDALNEGDGLNIWPKYLASFRHRLARSEWLGLVVSIRTDYEQSVLPEEWQDLFDDIEHYGFEDQVQDAAQKYFAHYGIIPTAPPLDPEFANPLFLKLLCKGLQSEGLNRVPSGLNGISAIFSFHLRSLNQKLARDDRMSFDPNLPMVSEAVELIVNKMDALDVATLPRSEIEHAIDGLHPPTVGTPRRLYRNLINEDLLFEHQIWSEAGATVYVRFTFERFADHLLAARMIAPLAPCNEPGGRAVEESEAGRMMRAAVDGGLRRGIFEALTVHVPEKFDRELFEFVPELEDSVAANRAFINSLIWRDGAKVTTATRQRVDRLLNSQLRPQLLDALCSIAPQPNHLLNASELHEHLVGLPLPDRDAMWTTFLAGSSARAVHSLVRWAREPDAGDALDSESLRLTGTTLTWILAASIPRVRDCATKALVRLYEGRLEAFAVILRTFAEIDDPYILERLLAVANGAAMRKPNDPGLKAVALYVCERFLKDPERLPHYLARDHARGVVEVANRMGLVSPEQLKRARPGYGSRWPGVSVPSMGFVERWKRDESANDDRAKAQLWRSIFHRMDDFNRSFIDDFERWSTVRFCDSRPTLETQQRHFISTLTSRQKDAYERYRRARQAVGEQPFFVWPPAEGERDMELEKARKAFVRTLGKAKADRFDSVSRGHLLRFDGDLARRWILGRVLQLGWSQERFGEFDFSVGAYNSHSDRGLGTIGQKYSLIAIGELSGRLADNFWFCGESHGREICPYEGPWQLLSRRTIDPSNLLHESPRTSWWNDSSRCWWLPATYSGLNDPVADEDWLRTSDEWPSFEAMLSVQHPSAGSEWLLLYGDYRWAQSDDKEDELYRRKPYRSAQCWFEAFLVTARDLEALVNAAQQHDFAVTFGQKANLADVYLGEFFWAPAYKYQERPQQAIDGWFKPCGLPKKILATTLSYWHEPRALDQSIDEGIGIYLVSRQVAEGFKVCGFKAEGVLVDSSGLDVAIDPSCLEEGPGALLVRRAAMETYLEENDLKLIWLVGGEKYLHNPSSEPHLFQGRLEMSGLHHLTSAGIQGIHHFHWNGPAH